MANAKNNKDEASAATDPTVFKRDLTRSDVIAQELAKVAQDADPALVAGAIAIFAAENIKRSAHALPDARDYLRAMCDAIDGLLVNAFPVPEEKPENEIRTHMQNEDPR